uniref:Ribonuclease III n=1 Tax=Pithovirus LCPAC001 TaxID=2506585 RepID=A0A481Z3K4_9VIRU|nr:MAG: ribonuclease III [Pithovirus LCPAC001]
MESKNIRKLNVPNYNEWKKNLQIYIKTDLVNRILPSEDPGIEKYRKIMISDKAMKIWAAAFTHRSYNPITDQNFDVLEYLGDRMLGYALGVYMKKKYPKSTEDNLNNFDTSFASRKPLSKISIKIGLFDHILTIQNLTTEKEISDVFESVVGAITKIGDTLISPGLGFMLAYNYITSIYNWYDELTIETRVTSLTNQVMQGYYDALGWKSSSESNVNFERWDNDTKTLTLYLNGKAIKMLTQRGTPPDNIEAYQGSKRAILATSTGQTHKEASADLYRSALRTLQSVYKISPKEAKVANIRLYIQDLASKDVISRDNGEKLYKNIIERNKEYDVDWNKQKYMQTKNGKVYILNGHQTEQNLDIILYRIVFESKEDENLSKLRLFQAYAKYGKIKGFDYQYYPSDENI